MQKKEDFETKPDLKAASKGNCAACNLSKTVYPTALISKTRESVHVKLCIDCITKARSGAWPLPADYDR